MSATPLFDFEQAPPISVPYRFFLTAPLFAAAAGLGLAWLGTEAFTSRWSFSLLAVVHLFTLGFMVQAMGGALLQILPVAAGAEVRAPHMLANLAHPGLTLGTLLLAAAFGFGEPGLFMPAMLLLAAVMLGYVAMTGAALARSPARGATVAALRLAVLSLLFTLLVGEVLASAFGWSMNVPLMELVSLHAAWGLLGWGLLLVMGVAYLVVPMFQLTPPYRPRLALALPLSVFALLVTWSMLKLVGAGEVWSLAPALLMALPVAAFALVTLVLQFRRRRRLGDVTLSYWRTGMLCLLGALILVLVVLLQPQGAQTERLEILAGVLLLPGLFFSLIAGMLYKIMPFLNWLHLQRVQVQAPNMKHMLAEKAMLRQFRVHLVALAMLCLAVFVPVLVRPAGLLLAVSALLLEWNLLGVWRVYRRLAGTAPVVPAPQVS